MQNSDISAPCDEGCHRLKSQGISRIFCSSLPKIEPILHPPIRSPVCITMKVELRWGKIQKKDLPFISKYFVEMHFFRFKHEQMFNPNGQASFTFLENLAGGDFLFIKTLRLLSLLLLLWGQVIRHRWGSMTSPLRSPKPNLGCGSLEQNMCSKRMASLSLSWEESQAAFPWLFSLKRWQSIWPMTSRTWLPLNPASFTQMKGQWGRCVWVVLLDASFLRVLSNTLTLTCSDLWSEGTFAEDVSFIKVWNAFLQRLWIRFHAPLQYYYIGDTEIGNILARDFSTLIPKQLDFFDRYHGLANRGAELSIRTQIIALPPSFYSTTPCFATEFGNICGNYSESNLTKEVSRKHRTVYKCLEALLASSKPGGPKHALQNIDVIYVIANRAQNYPYFRHSSPSSWASGSSSFNDPWNGSKWNRTSSLSVCMFSVWFGLVSPVLRYWALSDTSERKNCNGRPLRIIQVPLKRPSRPLSPHLCPCKDRFE